MEFLITMLSMLSNRKVIQQENESMLIILCEISLSKKTFLSLIRLFRPPEENRQTALERQIDYCLSMNYERVREQLKRLDTCRHGTVTANEIRLIVEDLINYTLKPDEYYQFLKQIPMDENGRVKYKQFLNQLLDRTLLVQEQQLKSSRSPQYEFTQPINPKDKLNTQQLKQKRTEKHEDSIDNFNQSVDSSSKTRSIDEVQIILCPTISIRIVFFLF